MKDSQFYRCLVPMPAVNCLDKLIITRSSLTSQKTFFSDRKRRVYHKSSSKVHLTHKKSIKTREKFQNQSDPISLHVWDWHPSEENPYQKPKERLWIQISLSPHTKEPQKHHCHKKLASPRLPKYLTCISRKTEIELGLTQDSPTTRGTCSTDPGQPQNEGRNSHGTQRCTYT